MAPLEDDQDEASFDPCYPLEMTSKYCRVGGRPNAARMPTKGGETQHERPPTGKRCRATLTKEQAALIYALRPDSADPHPNKIAGNSVLLSKRFGVSPKAVRDVWNRRTWAHATKDSCDKRCTPDDLDLLERGIGTEKTTARPRAQLQDQLESKDTACRARAKVEVQRSPGRPMGSKDTKPRRRRVAVKSTDGSSGFEGVRMHASAALASQGTLGHGSTEYGWASQGGSPNAAHEFVCGDAMDYLYPSMGMGESGVGMNVGASTREAVSPEDPSDDRSFPFFLSASILGQQAEFWMPPRTHYPSQGMGPMSYLPARVRTGVPAHNVPGYHEPLPRHYVYPGQMMRGDAGGGMQGMMRGCYGGMMGGWEEEVDIDMRGLARPMKHDGSPEMTEVMPHDVGGMHLGHLIRSEHHRIGEHHSSGHQP